MSAGENETHAGWPETRATLRRLVFVLALVGLTGAASGGAATASPPVRSTQELVTLLSPHAVRSSPNASTAPFASVEARRPITGARTVLLVLGRAGGGWLHVQLPGRPNGRTGWMRAGSTTQSLTPWHIVVATSSRRVFVFRDARVVRTFRAVVGKPSTPTPTGTFFVEEAIRLSPRDVGAPFALALSARSNVLQEFAGGPGQIALHGRMNIGGVLGTAASHGCVRLDDSAMRWLVGRIGVGVPVTVL